MTGMFRTLNDRFKATEKLELLLFFVKCVNDPNNIIV